MTGMSDTGVDEQSCQTGTCTLAATSEERDMGLGFIGTKTVTEHDTGATGTWERRSDGEPFTSQTRLNTQVGFY